MKNLECYFAASITGNSLVGSVLSSAIFLVLLFLPYFIARRRGHSQSKIILVLCVFGFVGVTWLIALIWAIYSKKQSLADPVLGHAAQEQESPKARGVLGSLVEKRLGEVMSRFEPDAIEAAIRFYDLRKSEDFEKLMVGCFKIFCKNGKTVERKSRIEEDLALGLSSRTSIYKLIEDIFGVKVDASDLNKFTLVDEIIVCFESKVRARIEFLAEALKDAPEVRSAWTSSELASLEKYNKMGNLENLLPLLGVMISEALGNNSREQYVIALKEKGGKFADLAFIESGIEVNALNEVMAKHLCLQTEATWSTPQKIMELVSKFHHAKTEILEESRITKIRYDKFTNMAWVEGKDDDSGVRFTIKKSFEETEKWEVAGWLSDNWVRIRLNYCHDFGTKSDGWGVLIKTFSPREVLRHENAIEFFVDNARLNLDLKYQGAKAEFKDGKTMLRERATGVTTKDTLVQIATAKKIAARIGGTEMDDGVCKKLQEYINAFVAETNEYDLTILPHVES